MPLRRRSRWRSRASASWASRPSCSCDGSSRPRTTSRGSPSASPRSARRSRSVLSLPCGSPFRRLNHAPTVDHQHLAGYIGGCVGSEIDGGVGDVLGRAPPSERNLRGDALLHRGLEPAAVRGLDPAGTEHVHTDPRRDRVRERPAEGVHASLRRAEHLGVVTLDSACEPLPAGRAPPAVSPAPRRSVRYVTATSAPAAAYARAIARPMPLDAPVTTATLPSSDRIPGASTALPDAGNTSFTCCFDIAPPNA